MNEYTNHIAVLSVQFQIPDSQSLKSKRRVLKSIKDRLRGQFNVSVSEIGEHDKWQSCVIGICMIGTDKSHMMASLEGAQKLISSVDEVIVSGHQLDFL
jgi:uncharacterized protein